MSLSAGKGGMGGIEPAATTFTESYAKPLQHTPRQGSQWTAGESNPNLRYATPASSRWTSSPFNQMIPDGLEPSLPGCKPAVVAAGPRDRSSATSGDNRRGGRVCLYRRRLTV